MNIMEYIYERKINYYETDKMGVIHHSNYIRYMEEARCEWLDKEGMPFDEFERNDITIPVLGVSCKYKYHATFGDIIQIRTKVSEYTGVRMTVTYEIYNKETGKLLATGETKHGFTNNALKPIMLKKHAPEFDKKFLSMLDK